MLNSMYFKQPKTGQMKVFLYSVLMTIGSPTNEFETNELEQYVFRGGFLLKNSAKTLGLLIE